MLQFNLPSAHSVRVPASEAQGFPPSRPTRAYYHFSAMNRISFFKAARGRGTNGERGEGCEERTRQLHKCFDGEAIVMIKDVLDRGGGILGGDHQVGDCGFVGRGFDARGCVLFCLPTIRFVAAVDLGLAF